MPTAANIVLADAQATPVNHTFIPMGREADGTYWFEDQSQATPLGFWKISVQLKRPPAASAGTASGSDRVSKAIITLHEPTMETLGTADNGLVPPPTLAYITRAKLEYTLPERGVLQNRKDIRKMMSSLNDNALVVAVIETLQQITG